MATGLEVDLASEWREEEAPPWKDDFELEREVGNVERAAPWEGGGGWMVHYLKQMDEEEQEETLDEPQAPAAQPQASMAPPWWDLAAETPPQLDESLLEDEPSPSSNMASENWPYDLVFAQLNQPSAPPTPPPASPERRRRVPKGPPKARIEYQRADYDAEVFQPGGYVVVPPEAPPMPPSRTGYTPGEVLPSTTVHDMADFFSRMRVYATDVVTGKCRDINKDPMDHDPVYRDCYRRLQTNIQSEQDQMLHEESQLVEKDPNVINWNRQMAQQARARRPPDSRPLPNALVPVQLRGARRFIADANARDCRLRDYVLNLGMVDDVPMRPPRYDPNFLQHSVEPIGASLAPDHVRTALIKAHEFLEPVEELVAVPCMSEMPLVDLSFPEPVVSRPTPIRHGSYAQELFDSME